MLRTFGILALYSAVCRQAEAETGAAAPEADAKPARAPRVEQNGISRPNPDTVIGRIWALADTKSQELGRPATRSELKEIASTEIPDLNAATFATQYARWTTFHGVADLLKQHRAQLVADRKQAAENKKAEEKAARAAETQRKQQEKLAAKEAEGPAPTAPRGRKAKAAAAPVAEEGATEAATA